MQTRAMIQTIGTVSSLVLAFTALKITHNIFEIDIRNLTDVFSIYPGSLLFILTVVIMVTTGLSYFKSRVEHEGWARFLYLLVAIAHVVIAPAALVIGFLKIEFGQYWWAVLVGILLLIYWGSQQKESQN